MGTGTKRIDQLEDRLGIATLKRPCTPVVVTNSGCDVALRHDACVEMLREGGFLPAGVLFGIVDLRRVSRGLRAQELQRFLRENDICGPRR